MRVLMNSCEEWVEKGKLIWAVDKKNKNSSGDWKGEWWLSTVSWKVMMIGKKTSGMFWNIWDIFTSLSPPIYK